MRLASTRFQRLPAIPGIPSAPIGKDQLNDADRYVEERKRRLKDKLPLLTSAQIMERTDAYHESVLRSLTVRGYHLIVKEINSIIKKEEHDRRIMKIWQYMHREPLVQQETKLNYIVDVLKACDDALIHQDIYKAALIRKQCGERLLQDEDIWLAKYMFKKALVLCEKAIPGHLKNKLLAELHCLIAFIIRETEDNAELALQYSLKHLQACRDLSKDKPWLLKPNLLVIKLKKPITLHGLREDYEIIDGCSMLLYHIATLLQHEMLLGVANHVLHHRTMGLDVTQSVGVFLQASLQLAYLVGQPVALVSSLMRFGTILRISGNYESAMEYFNLLVKHSEHFGFPESMAIGYHEIGLCYLGKKEMLTGLEYLVKEKAIGDIYDIPEIQADALQEIAYVLLEEGHLWESEECYFLAWRIFDEIQTKREAEEHEKYILEHENDAKEEQEAEAEEDVAEPEPELEFAPRRNKEKPTDTFDFADRDFAFVGICAGEKLWSQLSGLIIHGETEKIMEDLIDWKMYRQQLPSVPRPNYNVDLIEDIYPDPNRATAATVQANKNRKEKEAEEEGREEAEEEVQMTDKQWEAWMNQTNSQVQRRASRTMSTTVRRLNRLQQLEETVTVEAGTEPKAKANTVRNPQPKISFGVHAAPNRKEIRKDLNRR